MTCLGGLTATGKDEVCGGGRGGAGLFGLGNFFLDKGPKTKSHLRPA